MRQGYFTLNSFCNQQCITCPTSSNGKCNYNIPFDDLKRSIDDAISKGMDTICLSGGEPLAYNNFDKLFAYLYKTKLRIIILTNGTLLKGKTIKVLSKFKDRLKIVTAIHSDSSEIHEQITQTPGSFDLVMENLKMANQEGFRISVKIILNSKNIDSLKSICFFLSNNFVNPFIVNVCSMDFVGIAKNNKNLVVTGKQIREALNDLSLWYIHNSNKKYGLFFSEFPICLMTGISMQFLSLSNNNRQFAYLGRNGKIGYNTEYDCNPCLEKCRSCILACICPGLWRSTADFLEKDCFSFGR